MERKAVQKQFSTFLSRYALNPKQIRFIEMIIDHLCYTGTLAPEALYEQPFQSLDARGPNAIFPDEKILQGIFDQLRTMGVHNG